MTIQMFKFALERLAWKLEAQLEDLRIERSASSDPLSAIGQTLAKVKECEQRCLLEVSNAETERDEAVRESQWLREQNTKLRAAYEEAVAQLVVLDRASPLSQNAAVIPDRVQPQATTAHQLLVPASGQHAIRSGNQRVQDVPNVKADSMGRTEIAYLWELFRRYDSSNGRSGLLDAELAGFLSTLQLCNSKADTSEIFVDMDKKGNGFIGFGDLVVAMDACCAADADFATHIHDRVTSSREGSRSP